MLAPQDRPPRPEDASGQGQSAAPTTIAREAKACDREVPRERRPFRVDVLPSQLGFAQARELRGDDVDRPMCGLVGSAATSS